MMVSSRVLFVFALAAVHLPCAVNANAAHVKSDGTALIEANAALRKETQKWWRDTSLPIVKSFRQKHAPYVYGGLTDMYTNESGRILQSIPGCSDFATFINSVSFGMCNLDPDCMEVLFIRFAPSTPRPSTAKGIHPPPTHPPTYARAHTQT